MGLALNSIFFNIKNPVQQSRLEPPTFISKNDFCFTRFRPRARRTRYGVVRNIGKLGLDHLTFTMKDDEDDVYDGSVQEWNRVQGKRSKRFRGRIANIDAQACATCDITTGDVLYIRLGYCFFDYSLCVSSFLCFNLPFYCIGPIQNNTNTQNVFQTWRGGHKHKRVKQKRVCGQRNRKHKQYNNGKRLWHRTRLAHKRTQSHT